MRIVIAGGTGLIGAYLTKQMQSQGHEVRLVSRSSHHVPWLLDALVQALEHTDVLINLAGKSINCRHTKANKKLILDSRVETTILLGRALEQCQFPPSVWINASAIANYIPSNETASVETSETSSATFLGSVVQQWEDVFFKFSLPGVRKVVLRTSVVLSNQGGAFIPLRRLTKFGLGGRIASGKQMFSWIHIADYANAIHFIIHNKTQAVVNVSSPEPVSQHVFMQKLRRELRVCAGLPAPAFVVKIAAFVLGTESSLVLDAAHVYPQKLTTQGFDFLYPTVDSALKALVDN